MDKHEEYFAKPFIEPFNDNTLKIRRNLMVTSAIAIIYALGSDGIDPSNSRIFGVQFNNVSATTIEIALAVLIIYLLAHFIWNAIDDLKAWRLRLTARVWLGKSNAYIVESHLEEEKAESEKQATLSSWVLGQKEKVDGIINNIRKEEQKILEKTDLRKNEFEHYIGGIQKELTVIKEKDEYIKAALERYAKGYKSMQTSQLARWICMEFLIPGIMGVCALFFIYPPHAHANQSQSPDDYKAAIFTYAGLPKSQNDSSKYSLLINENYAVGYSETLKNPLWVAYRIGNMKGDFSDTKWERPFRFGVSRRFPRKVHSTAETPVIIGLQRGYYDLITLVFRSI